MNNKCNVCGTENEPEYKFCKNCGSEIAVEQNVHNENKEENYSQTQNTGYTVNSPVINNVVDSISGIPTNEVAVFVGKKAVNIIPKFSKMQLTGSKVSWCWPVFVLALIFGPLGAAFWFFYRKMYKPAVILTVIGAILTFITSLFAGNIVIDEELLENALISGNFEELFNSFSNVKPIDAILTAIVTTVSDIIDTLTAVLCGIFGFNIYKNHCIDKIREYRIIQEDKRFYGLGLAAIGGVSGGMAFLGVIIMIIAQNAADIIKLVI